MTLRLGALDKAIGAQQANDIVVGCRANLVHAADFAQRRNQTRQERGVQIHGCEGQFMRGFLSERVQAVPGANEIGRGAPAGDKQGRVPRPLRQNVANDGRQFGKVEQAPADFVDRER